MPSLLSKSVILISLWSNTASRIQIFITIIKFNFDPTDKFRYPPPQAMEPLIWSVGANSYECVYIL